VDLISVALECADVCAPVQVHRNARSGPPRLDPDGLAALVEHAPTLRSSAQASTHCTTVRDHGLGILQPSRTVASRPGLAGDHGRTILRVAVRPREPTFISQLARRATLLESGQEGVWDAALEPAGGVSISIDPEPVWKDVYAFIGLQMPVQRELALGLVSVNLLPVMDPLRGRRAS
jgi:hypothetical protein